jgi:hypothetical protein
VRVVRRHHLLVRCSYWLNVPILLGLILSGLSICWASPVYQHKQNPVTGNFAPVLSVRPVISTPLDLGDNLRLRPGRLPTASVSTAIYVEHLSAHLRRLRKVENSIHNVFYVRYFGCNVLRESLGSSVCIGVSTTPGATALKRMPSFAYSIARLRITEFRPPFVIIGTEPSIPAIG